MLRLNPTEQKIAALLAREDRTQSDTARALGISRQYVSRVAKKLRGADLLRPSEKTPGPKNQWFAAAPELRPTPPPVLSSCRVHNVRLKYRIRVLAGRLSLDPVAVGYFRSWEMRGGRRHKFSIPSSGPNSPRITIDVHPNTIVAYPDAGQNILAASVETAEARITLAIHEAVVAFCSLQYRAGCDLRVDHPDRTGALISSPHYAFPIAEPLAAEGITLPGWWVDHSCGADAPEVETSDRAAASALDRGISRILALDRTLSALGGAIDRVEELHAALLAGTAPGKGPVVSPAGPAHGPARVKS